ncbi:MAG: cytochrome-c oxidase, cbb3-type subunit II, partial [Emcibacteraceae bacterium]|nr:cytochrome-c oxidase, cbb3-type subunit II [Emcibacteraceae bacterium]
NCHSQMIRSTRDEVERYGHYSLAAESMYDHPQLWGSKRNGPDLARVGNKYSDEWHREHLINPSSVVPETIMPGYPFLAGAKLKYNLIGHDLKVNQMLGVPYTDEQVENAIVDLRAQLDEDSDDYDAFIERYPTAQVRNFDGDASKITELDALISYLQMLGTLVDFSLYNDSENNR